MVSRWSIQFNELCSINLLCNIVLIVLANLSIMPNAWWSCNGTEFNEISFWSNTFWNSIPKKVESESVVNTYGFSLEIIFRNTLITSSLSLLYMGSQKTNLVNTSMQHNIYLYSWLCLWYFCKKNIHLKYTEWF